MPRNSMEEYIVVLRNVSFILCCCSDDEFLYIATCISLHKCSLESIKNNDVKFMSNIKINVWIGPLSTGEWEMEANYV